MSNLGWWTAPSPELELELGDIKRANPLPLGTLEALDAMQLGQRAKLLDYRDQAETAVVPELWMQRALEIHSELEEESEAWRDRAAVREAIANKLLNEMFPWAHRDRGFESAKEYLLAGQKLLIAREFGLWAVDPMAEPDDEVKTLFYGRAGLVKLCPDDARNEGQRVAALYGERLDLCNEGGYVLRYAVFSLPNFPQWHLGAGIDTIKQAFHDKITHALADGGVARSMSEEGRLFPDLVGAIACVEAPLSARYAEDPSNAWNVHLNAILVFKQSKDQPFGRPDYEPLRAAWDADVHFAMIPQGDRDATRAAVRECVKYPLQAVAEKSGRRKVKRDAFGNVLPAAPAMIEWPPEFFDEWWRSFKGVRRTWSCGLVYSRKMNFARYGNAPDGLVIELPKPPKRDPDRWHFMGTIRLSPAACYISPPRADFREAERAKRRRAFEHRARMSSDPEYAAAYDAKVDRWERKQEHVRRRELAEAALFTLILGNNSATDVAMPVIEASFSARGPP